MTPQEKVLARKLFKIKIYENEGQAFEQLFTQIMNYAYPDFIQIKPQGRYGDRKNDGYIPSLGYYYQVYAPENPEATRTRNVAVAKARDDFKGLIDAWHHIHPIEGYRFAFNDKYKGSFPAIEEALAKIKTEYKLEVSEVFLAKHLEDVLFSLDADRILTIVGFIPDPAAISDLDYSLLSEVIEHIIKVSRPIDLVSALTVPDFDKKIQFNGLSHSVAAFLQNGSYQSGAIDEYFNKNSVFARQELRDALNKIYLASMEEDYAEVSDDVSEGDLRFFHILNKITPVKSKSAQDAAFVLMAYYFESCDIFEDPS